MGFYASPVLSARRKGSRMSYLSASKCLLASLDLKYLSWNHLALISHGARSERLLECHALGPSEL